MVFVRRGAGDPTLGIAISEIAAGLLAVAAGSALTYVGTTGASVIGWFFIVLGIAQIIS